MTFFLRLDYCEACILCACSHYSLRYSLGETALVTDDYSNRYSHLSHYSTCVMIPSLLGGKGRGFPFVPRAPFSPNGVEVGVAPRLA